MIQKQKIGSMIAIILFLTATASFATSANAAGENEGKSVGKNSFQAL